MTSHSETVRIIRVFVSSPSDVQEERGVLDEVVRRINRTGGDALNVRLELWKWEQDSVPQIGPKPQSVIDAQMPRHDIYLGIMKHRFGTPTGRYGSGTEKEFEVALRLWGEVGSPWILFYFGKEMVDPDKLDMGQYAKVRQFREELEKKGLCATYERVRGSGDAFFEKVDEHLRKILQLLVPLTAGPPRPLPADTTKYLRDLLSKTAYIDIRGLQIGHKHKHVQRFPIEDLFISLTATQTTIHTDKEPAKRGRGGAGKSAEMERALTESRTLPLDVALSNDRLVVLGDPGAGKTTFVRRVAHALCETELGGTPEGARTRLKLADRTFPILVRLNELDEHISRHRNTPSAPVAETSQAWLPHFLTAVGRDNNWGLHDDFFRGQLENGLCTVLLDGLDEASDRVSRRRLGRLIEAVAGAYKGCRLVVTSRPAGYTDETHLEGFTHAHIDPLSDDAVKTFLTRWCDALYIENHDAARHHCADLLSELGERPDIRKMVRNAVMLTALAVVHWNEHRLPEQRVDLYESIIHWLSRAREGRPGREKAERTVVHLRELALAMQYHPGGMRTEVPKRWAADKLAPEWASGEVDAKAIERAEAFLHAEVQDSGIIVDRGDKLQFWHRTFQEFLAARAIAARPDAGQEELLWGPPSKLYLPEWREVMLLLAGILHGQGRDKVDNLVRTMLDHAGANAPLADHARCMGLLGAIVQDLTPVEYKIADRRYEKLRDRVMGIFDREQSKRVPTKDRIDAADALGQAGDPRFHGRDVGRKAYWMAIEAGAFWMGAQSTDPAGTNHDPDAYEDEAPIRKVYLDGFSIARYPVTVGQYRRFVEGEGYQDERYWEAGGFGEFSLPEKWEDQLQYPSHPVVSVSWYEASAYCRWAGCRLPSEAQWERAARGVNGRKYPWGNEGAHPSRLNYGKSGIGHATPVGIYPLGATPEGICDLAGNVWEWCADWYGGYAAEDLINPSGPKKASDRVFRGGSWYSVARDCRASFRIRFVPWYRSLDLGFRVVLVPPGQQASPSKDQGREPGAQAEGAGRRSPPPRAGVEGGKRRRAG